MAGYWEKFSFFLRTFWWDNYTTYTNADPYSRQGCSQMAERIEDFNEGKIVEAACNGCLESFGALYERYHSAMVALAYSMLADRDLAEDAAQEVFTVACGSIGTLKNREKFGPWLAAICRNISRQMLRAGKGPQRVALRDEPAAGGHNESLEQHEAIHGALRRLRQAERELIVLRYFDGFSQAQISRVLDLSPQAVNGRLARAKRKIAEYLKRNGLAGAHYESAR